MNKLSNLKISGMGKMNGGKFDEVDISGVGKVFGDIEANKLKISGSGSIEGSAKVSDILIEGNARVDGEIESQSLKVSGNFKVGGQIKSENIDNEGRLKIGGGVKAKKIRSEGSFSTMGAVETEEFISEGAFSINGLLNSQKVDAKIQWSCDVNEIGGEEVSIRRGRPWGINFFLAFLGKSCSLTAQTIEATKVYLENTNAKVVRGANIKIGCNCAIDVVEYSGELEVDPSSTVREKRKM